MCTLSITLTEFSRSRNYCLITYTFLEHTAPLLALFITIICQSRKFPIHWLINIYSYSYLATVRLWRRVSSLHNATLPHADDTQACTYAQNLHIQHISHGVWFTRSHKVVGELNAWFALQHSVHRGHARHQHHAGTGASVIHAVVRPWNQTFLESRGGFHETFPPFSTCVTSECVMPRCGVSQAALPHVR